MEQDPNIETIIHESKVLAIIAKTNNIDSNSYFSPEDFFLQAGIQNHTAGKKFDAHEHPPYNENEINPQEIMYVVKGKVEVGLYHSEKKIESRTLLPGDLMLINSGHDLTYLEDSKLLIVKTGPYRGKATDKKVLR